LEYGDGRLQHLSLVDRAWRDCASVRRLEVRPFLGAVVEVSDDRIQRLPLGHSVLHFVHYDRSAILSGIPLWQEGW